MKKCNYWFCSIDWEKNIKQCKFWGNKNYWYWFLNWSAEFCRKSKEWVHKLKKCPLIEKTKKIKWLKK